MRDVIMNVGRWGLFNFNSVQRSLVLEDYAPALRVRGFVSRKKCARSMGEEKKEGTKK